MVKEVGEEANTVLEKAADKFIEVVLTYEWQVVSAGLAFRPFDWRLEGLARKWYTVVHVGPIKVWAGIN